MKGMRVMKVMCCILASTTLLVSTAVVELVRIDKQNCKVYEAYLENSKQTSRLSALALASQYDNTTVRASDFSDVYNDMGIVADRLWELKDESTEMATTFPTSLFDDLIYR